MNGKLAASMRGDPTTVVGPRYHPDVIWGPFLLALVLGLLVSAGIYFAYLWPSVEPDPGPGDEPAAGSAGGDAPE